jgi:hypothetical protein
MMALSESLPIRMPTRGLSFAIALPFLLFQSLVR